MPHTSKGVLLCFLVALAVFAASSLLARVELHFFIPPIVMLLSIGSLAQTAWASLLVGCFLDTATHSPRLGFIALAYLLATYTLHSCKRMLTRDSPVTLLILTYVFSLLATLFEIVIGLVLDIPLPAYSIGWILSETLMMPLLDVVYAFVVFSLPQFLLSRYHVRRRIK